MDVPIKGYTCRLPASRFSAALQMVSARPPHTIGYDNMLTPCVGPCGSQCSRCVGALCAMRTREGVHAHEPGIHAHYYAISSSSFASLPIKKPVVGPPDHHCQRCCQRGRRPTQIRMTTVSKHNLPRSRSGRSKQADLPDRPLPPCPARMCSPGRRRPAGGLRAAARGRRRGEAPPRVAGGSMQHQQHRNRRHGRARSWANIICAAAAGRTACAGRRVHVPPIVACGWGGRQSELQVVRRLPECSCWLRQP